MSLCCISYNIEKLHLDSATYNMIVRISEKDACYQHQ